MSHAPWKFRFIFIPTTPRLPLFTLFMYVVASEGASRRTPSVLPARPASGDSLVEIQRQAQRSGWKLGTCDLVKCENAPAWSIRQSYCHWKASKGIESVFWQISSFCFLICSIFNSLLSVLSTLSAQTETSSAFRPLSPATRFQAETTSAYGTGS